jgi:hypothetical protein
VLKIGDKKLEPKALSTATMVTNTPAATDFAQQIQPFELIGSMPGGVGPSTGYQYGFNPHTYMYPPPPMPPFMPKYNSPYPSGSSRHNENNQS